MLVATVFNLLCVVSLSAGCVDHVGTSGTATAIVPETASTEQSIAPETMSQPEPALPERPYLVEAGTLVPTSFDPMLPKNGASQRVVDNVFDSLLKVNAETASLGPSLASDWSISEDALTITFSLTEDALWHDGEPFTADDVAFTFEAILDTSLDTPFKANLVGVDEFYAIDRNTFVVTLTSADCSLLVKLGQIPIIPQHLFVTGVDNGSNNTDLLEEVSWEHPIGTGPFKLKETLATGEVHLEANANYFGGVPNIAEWVYLPCTGVQQILTGLREGGIDLAQISPQEALYFQHNDNVRMVTFPESEYYALMINMTRPSLIDTGTREALAYAIDRQRLVEELLDGYGQVVDSSWLPSHWVNDPADPPVHFSPERAVDLLEQAGWTDNDGDHLLDRDGEPLQINIAVNAENERRKQIAFAVQRDWIDIGVSAEVNFVEFYALMEKLFAQTFDVAVFSWPMHPDPDQSLFWASAEAELQGDFNVVSYADPAVDEALLAGLTASSCDPRARIQAYQQVITAIEQDQPYIFLFAPEQVIAFSQRLTGLKPGPYANLSWNISDWALETIPSDS